MIAPPSPEILDAVIGIVMLYADERNVSARSSLRGDLALDDLDRMGIACEITRLLGIDATDHEVVEWETVEDIARTVEWHQRRKVA